MNYEVLYNEVKIAHDNLMREHLNLLESYKDYEQSDNKVVKEVRKLRRLKMSLESQIGAERLKKGVLNAN